MEHLHHFGLSRDPFANETQLDLFFASESHAGCERRLLRGIRQSKGLCVLTGAAGSGKTMVARHLLDSLEEEVYEACLLVPVLGVSDGDWMLRRFAAQLGVEEPEEDRSALLAQLYEQMAIVREGGRATVLIVDEAQVLAESGALAELRGLLNLEYEERRLLTVVLVGLPELEEAIREVPGLAERVEIHARLEAMDVQASGYYVTHRLRAAGGNPAIIEASALKRLMEHGRGNPRRINVLADNALFEAFVDGRHAANEGDIEKAVLEHDGPDGSLEPVSVALEEPVDEDEVPTGEFTVGDAFAAKSGG